MPAFEFTVKKGREVVRVGRVAAKDREAAEAFVREKLEQKFWAFKNPEEYKRVQQARGVENPREYDGVALDPAKLTIKVGS